jgi:hypothetical protein
MYQHDYVVQLLVRDKQSELRRHLTRRVRPAAHGPLRQELQRWLARARRAGLDDESIEALFMTTFRTAV